MSLLNLNFKFVDDDVSSSGLDIGIGSDTCKVQTFKSLGKVFCEGLPIRKDSQHVPIGVLIGQLQDPQLPPRIIQHSHIGNFAHELGINGVTLGQLEFSAVCQVYIESKLPVCLEVDSIDEHHPGVPIDIVIFQKVLYLLASCVFNKPVDLQVRTLLNS